jgi:predicted ATP-binding protein involved in virulence
VKSIVSWVADLLMRMDRIPWVDDVPLTKRPFLLLLDEIDIHLHPAWQRRILPMVARLFPNAQIIASTHSPFVVGSAGEDAHIIRFEVKGGRSTLDPTKRGSQSGTSVSAVLAEVFGIKTEFDIDTEKALRAFDTARVRLLRGEAADRSEVDRLAHQLAARSEELADIMGMEMRQLERQLKKPVAS